MLSNAQLEFPRNPDVLSELEQILEWVYEDPNVSKYMRFRKSVLMIRIYSNLESNI